MTRTVNLVVTQIVTLVASLTAIPNVAHTVAHTVAHIVTLVVALTAIPNVARIVIVLQFAALVVSLIVNLSARVVKLHVTVAPVSYTHLTLPTKRIV